MTNHVRAKPRVLSGLKLPPTFRALRHRNFRLFFFGQLVSLIGTWMQNIAQQWLIYRLTGSSAMLGLVNLVGLIPLIPLSLWGGSLADRLPKRSILLTAQTIMMIQAFLLAFLTRTGLVQVWHVFVLATVLSAVSAIEMPTRQSFLVELVEGKEDLTNAIGLNSTIFHGARAIGPALAGIAVATTGEAGAFLLNGISFVAVIIGLLSMRALPLPAGMRTANVAQHLHEAAGYVRDNRILLVLISLVAVSALLSMPYNILLPVFAHDILKPTAQPMLDLVCHGGLATLLNAQSSESWINCQSPDALTYGILMAMTGVGALVGALWVASLPPTAPRGRWLTVGNLLFPAFLVGMAFSESFVLTLVLLVGVGFSFVAQNALANTLLQITVPDHMRGRVMSFYALSFQGMMRVGAMQAGVVGQMAGAPVAVGAGAFLSLLYSIYAALRFPKVRELA